MTRPLFSAVLSVVLAASVACGSEPEREAPTPVLVLDEHPGYPVTTSRLGSSLGDNLLKSCHATLVHPGWAVTAAHCFAGVAPESRGTLREFARGFSADEVEFYPGAHRSGETRLGTGWRREDFVAAHDLALVPLRPRVLEVAPVTAWQPQAACALNAQAQVIGELGIEDGGEGWTVEAAVLGRVEAASLLGHGHAGWLVAAQGPWVRPGDSGSGMTAAWSLLAPAAPGCEAVSAETGAPVLIGVVQDANPVDPSSPFGLVPLYGPEHASWLQSVLDATPEPSDSGPPRLLVPEAQERPSP